MPLTCLAHLRMKRFHPRAQMVLTVASSINSIFRWRQHRFEFALATNFGKPVSKGFENEPCDFDVEVCDAVAAAWVGEFVVEEGDKILSDELVVVGFF